MNARYLVVIVLAALICPDAMYGRTWTDASGKHKIEAELVGFRGGLVHLKKTDGTVLTIALDKLYRATRRSFVSLPQPPERIRRARLLQNCELTWAAG